MDKLRLLAAIDDGYWREAKLLIRLAELEAQAKAIEAERKMVAKQLDAM